MFDKLKAWFSPTSKIPVIGVDELPSAATGVPAVDYRFTYLDGDKFIGGFGDTQLHLIDYWTLRMRSIQLYNENLYAEGIVNSFITNVINTGLTLESKPIASILGMDQDQLNEWTDDIEARFSTYCNNPKLVDYYGEKTLSELQQQRELQALVEGDVLTVLHFDSKTMLPKVQLIPAGCVQTPFDGDYNIPKGHTIEHGVEKDANYRTVAYHVVLNDGKSKRFPRYGSRSGRVVANLYIPGKNLLGNCRGMPLLANVLQSLREIDRYRDSVQRKALVSSFLALAVEKDADTIGAKPLGAASTRSASINDGKYSLNMKSFNPGVVIDDMPAGHKIKMMGSEGTDLSFAEFEASILNAIAWSKGMPPEILKKQFGSNYAASKQANAEWGMFLDMERTNTTRINDQPVFESWLYVETLKGRISSPGLIEAWDDPEKYDIKGAWIAGDWAGSIKPNADLVKEVQGFKLAVEEGFCTRDYASRSLFNKKFAANARDLVGENALLLPASELLVTNLSQSIINTNADEKSSNNQGEDDVSSE